jgi:hypothetical protein
MDIAGTVTPHWNSSREFFVMIPAPNADRMSVAALVAETMMNRLQTSAGKTRQKKCQLRTDAIFVNIFLSERTLRRNSGERIEQQNRDENWRNFSIN